MSDEKHPSELEAVVTEVTESYAAGRLIDSLSSARLPNKRQVTEALNHLKAVIYLGYYATRDLDESKVRFAVASHLYRAHEILCEQIGRAVRYEGFRSQAARDDAWPERITVAFLRGIPAIRALPRRMSRIGKLPVPVPDGVQVEIQGQAVTVQGPKGKLSLAAHPAVQVEVVDTRLVCRRSSDEKAHKALHGLTRSLLRNMVQGVVNGFERRLDLVGVGYRASLLGAKTLNLSLGYSHPIIYPIPDGIRIDVKDQTQLVVSGIDKQLVGAVAAKIRSFRPPEPYKGKGVKYAEERIRRKAGKTGAK